MTVRAVFVRRPGDWWRRPLDPIDWTDSPVFVGVRWQWGRVAIEPDSLSFQDADCPASWHQFPPDCGELAYTILNDPVLREVVVDYVGSQALAALVNGLAFTRRSNGLAQFLGWKLGLELAVDMRGLGEIAEDLDLSPLDSDATVFNDRYVLMQERLEQLGWDAGRA